jgi:hypothetical protein
MEGKEELDEMKIKKNSGRKVGYSTVDRLREIGPTSAPGLERGGCERRRGTDELRTDEPLPFIPLARWYVG